jgi:hypothetical protein
MSATSNTIDESYVQDFVTHQYDLNGPERLTRLRLIVEAGMGEVLERLESDLDDEASVLVALEQARWESSSERRWLRRFLEGLAGSPCAEVEDVVAADHFFIFEDPARSPEVCATWVWNTQEHFAAA